MKQEPYTKKIGQVLRDGLNLNKSPGINRELGEWGWGEKQELPYLDWRKTKLLL